MWHRLLVYHLDLSHPIYHQWSEYFNLCSYILKDYLLVCLNVFRRPSTDLTNITSVTDQPRFFMRLTWCFLFLDYSQFLTDPVWPLPFYKHLCNLFIHSFMECSFSSRSPRNHKSQIIRAREMDFWENVHPPLYVTCHKSHGLCQVSGVTYHFFFLLFFTKWWS